MFSVQLSIAISKNPSVVNTIYIYSIYGIRGQGLESYDNLCIPELGHDLPCPNWNPELGLESLYMAIYHKD